MKKGWMTFAIVAAAGLVHAAMDPIEGNNVVGFVEIPATAAKNTIVAVPFEACMQAGVASKLSDLVATYGLTAHASDPAQADQLVVLTTDGTDPVYYYYYNQTGVGWTPITTEQLMPDGTKKTLTPDAADVFPIARGQGFWIKRVAGTGSSVYVKGQVSAAKQSTTIGEGLNLISYAGLTAFDLNDLDWAGAGGANGISATTDRILVSKGDGTYYTTYHYYTGGSKTQFNGKWVTTTGGIALPAADIPAGQGFWYYRRSGGTFTFKPDGE